MDQPLWRSLTTSQATRVWVVNGSVFLFCAGFAAVTVFSAASPASAFVAGLTLSANPSVAFNALDGYTLGWLFNVSRVVEVDALGIFDSGDPGLPGSYDLGLWDLAGTLLTSTTVTGLGDGIENGFVWKSLPSVLALNPGDYVVGASGDYSTPLRGYVDGGAFNTLPGVTYIQNRFSVGASLQFPASSSGLINFGMIGGNFSEKLPVPAPLSLFGVAAAFGWTRRLRALARLSSSGCRAPCGS